MPRLLTRAIVLAALALSLLGTTDALGSAANYSGIICKNYVNYQVWVPPDQNISMIETNIVQAGMTDQKLGLLPPTCLNPFMEYVCSSSFPRAVPSLTPNNYSVIFACKSTCQSVVAKCSSIFTFAEKQNWIPNCDGPINGTVQTVSPNGALFQPDGSCNVVTSLSEGQNSFKCPAPFIPDPMLGPNGTTTNPTSCQSGCCLPCPAQASLYRAGAMDRLYKITDGVRTASMVLSFILLLSYTLFPEQRAYPNSLVFFKIICLFLYTTTVLFLLVNRRGLQCVDEINFSTQQNNTKCAIQGAISLLTTMGAYSWFVAIVLTLHLHTVWNNDWLARNTLLTHILCWGYPIAITAITLAMGEIKWESGSYCFISHEKASTLFFYPFAAAIVIPSFLIHVCTFVHVGRVIFKAGIDPSTASKLTAADSASPSISHHRHVVMVLKLQWRAALWAALALMNAMLYWLYYSLQSQQTKPEVLWPNLQNHFVNCLIDGGDQDTCADQLAPYLPPITQILVAETISSSFGIFDFIVFFRPALVHEWCELFKKVGYFLSGSEPNKREK